MKCRSDPQVVVSVTLTMTSWGLRMVGSSTFSTDRSLTPFQTSARMMVLSPRRCAGARVVLDGRDFSGLQKGAGSIERLEQQRSGQRAGRWAAHPADDLGPAILWRITEFEH